MTAVAESISNGNMTGWGSATYTWDEFNRLTAINGTSLDASYKYDALGRRIEKTIDNTTTRYLYDGADIVLEMDESNVATAYYIRTLNIDEPLARIELDSGGNVTGIRFYLADALGSIIALTDENGVIKTRYNYTPFGEPEVSGDSSDNPFMFTGRVWDRLGDSPEANNGTGLYYYRARYYSSELGRFISEDPIGLAGGINMYAYVGNSPLNFVDPLGLTEYWMSPAMIEQEQIMLYGPATDLQINPNGVTCQLLCGGGTSLMCWGFSYGLGTVSFGAGLAVGVPCTLGTKYVCGKICPSMFEVKEPKEDENYKDGQCNME